MFGLLKASWRHKSAEKRLQAIQNMDSLHAANQKILLNLANSDPDSSVRHSAINQLNDPNELFKISNKHVDDDTRSQAELALQQLLRTKDLLTEEQLTQLGSNHAELKLLIGTHCPYANLRENIIQSLSEIEQANIIANIEYTDTRQLIAQQLTNLDALEQARKLLKGKDKSAEKIIRAKIQEHQLLKKQEEENIAATLVICEKMEYVANHSSHPDFQAMFKVWSQRWEALSFTPNEDLSTRYLTAHAQAQKDISIQEKQDTLIKNQQLLTDDLQDYCKKVATLSWQELNNESNQIKETLEQSELIWNELLAASPNEPNALNDQFMQIQKSLTSLYQLCGIPSRDDTPLQELQEPLKPKVKALKQAINTIKWHKTLPKLQALTEASDALDELEQTNKQNAQESIERLDKLHKRINRLLGSTQRGSLGQAKRELIAVTKAAQQFSGKDKVILEERLQKAEDAFSKMGDWKDFASEPKFLALCEAMEKLIGLDTSPDALAKKISTLQNEWKSLGYADSADAHWDRFKTAADKAYEPCAVFFTQRRDTRQQNLDKREPLVTQMQTLSEQTNWDDVTDYKAIESELNNIMHAWRKIKDVERKVGQEQWDRLSVFKSNIYEKLDIIYDENIEAKNVLIENVKKLLDDTQGNQGNLVDKLKLFQTRWKQVGITRRKQDNIAWNDFKAATDAVYEKVQSSRKAKRAEEDTHLVGYRELIQQIRQLGKDQTSLNDADKAFEQLQADYQALPPLPKNLAEKLAERLDGDFKHACDAYNAARVKLKESEDQQALETLSEKVKLCVALEKSTAAEDIERLSNEINAIEIPNNELKRRFSTRLESAQQADRSQANQVRQRLCLDLEILLDVESPPEDKALRMQVQLDRMKNKGLGPQATDKDTTLQELKIDWLCLPGADPELQESLEQRFQHALTNNNSKK